MKLGRRDEKRRETKPLERKRGEARGSERKRADWRRSDWVRLDGEETDAPPAVLIAPNFPTSNYSSTESLTLAKLGRFFDWRIRLLSMVPNRRPRTE